MDADAIRSLILRWREDPGSTYRTWFLWEERLKNFRSIRTGLQKVMQEIEDGDFGTTYKGSSLEVVVGSIAEQRQMFKGADHAFLWKPKLRIPDIYENPENQKAFGSFLRTCACANGEKALIDAIRHLDARRIKGLGPAVANLMYFLHPTLMPPFNTAIVKGYNALMGSSAKLGKWEDYLAMREGMIRLTENFRDLLSNDLGAVAGLAFDVGTDRWAAPPREGDASAREEWERDLARVRQESASARKAREKELAGDRTHTQIQAWLRDLGRSLGFSVWVAANDRGRAWNGGLLGEGCLDCLPAAFDQKDSAATVRLIDVLWFDRDGNTTAAFEVEHTTSIESGIMRMLDLVNGAQPELSCELFIVAPDDREEDVRKQLQRPAFRQVSAMGVRYLPYSELDKNREAMARFGEGLKAIQAVSRLLV
ncbi:MAG: type II restriction endonuclease [Elusimicrobia bacterium]|nr:type II restriction endonuclease [Elusimicrobiota bacterium]